MVKTIVTTKERVTRYLSPALHLTQIGSAKYFHSRLYIQEKNTLPEVLRQIANEELFHMNMGWGEGLYLSQISDFWPRSQTIPLEVLFGGKLALTDQVDTSDVAAVCYFNAGQSFVILKDPKQLFAIAPEKAIESMIEMMEGSEHIPEFREYFPTEELSNEEDE